MRAYGKITGCFSFGKEKKRIEQVPLPKFYCQVLFKMMYKELGEIFSDDWGKS